MELNLENEINKDLNIEKKQKHFLESSLGKIINNAVDIGIRAILPDFFDDQIINIKNNLIEYGLKDGIKKTIDDGIELGKSAIGVFTGNFENIDQMHDAVKNGGIIDGMSALLDVTVNRVNKAGLINGNTANLLVSGKNIILNNIESNIENSFATQYKEMDLINKHIDNWKKDYEERNFDGMERQYKKIEKEIKSLAPIEKTISDVKTIETLHNLIKNNNKQFNLTNDEIELVSKLA